MKRELTNVVPCCIDEREWVSALDRRSQEQRLLDVGCGRRLCVEKFLQLSLDVTDCDIYTRLIADSAAKHIQKNVKITIW
jgi:predicted TPR repeat methyltransferase